MKRDEKADIFEAFNKLKVLIIGDVMVDAYDWGKVERISPEAPVPIIQLSARENRLGGAANVALNIQAMGATPILCSVIGDDLDGKDLIDLLAKSNMTDEGIIVSDSRVTTTKRRIISGSQHLLRIDHETTEDLDEETHSKLVSKLKMLLPEVDVVIFEDYDKGVISQKLILETVRLCRAANIPVAVDPKKKNFLYYEGVSIFKPNLKELKEGLKIDFNPDDIEQLDAAIQQLHQKIKADCYLITLSERGVYIKSEDEFYHIPAHKREISDVSGAGDTVISIAALCLALQLPYKLIAELSNLAGGMVCEHVGVVPIEKNKLLKEVEMKMNYSY